MEQIRLIADNHQHDPPENQDPRNDVRAVDALLMPHQRQHGGRHGLALVRHQAVSYTHLTVATSTSYLGQIRLEDEIAVTTVASKVGNKSVTLAQQLIHTAADGSRRVCSESTSVMVAFDFAAQQAVPVPDAWRKRMLGDGTDSSHSR